MIWQCRSNNEFRGYITDYCIGFGCMSKLMSLEQKRNFLFFPLTLYRTVFVFVAKIVTFEMTDNIVLLLPCLQFQEIWSIVRYLVHWWIKHYQVLIFKSHHSRRAANYSPEKEMWKYVEVFYIDIYFSSKHIRKKLII